MTIRVWAPEASSVTLVVDGGPTRGLVGQAGGWWTDPEAVAAGTRYRLSVDGGPPLPDPRSPSQPDGVFGPSETVDHGTFTWSDDDWHGPVPLASAVFYELHVGTFTAAGTFDGVIEQLGHLRSLGVTHVELMPVASFPGVRGWGYDGVLLYAPHHAYGGPEGLKRLVDAAHRAGLAVVVDVVYNHLGPSGNVLARFGPYFTDRYATPWGDAINLDGPDSDEVRRFLVDNAVMWLRDYHVDALRVDAVHAIVDMSAVHLLEQLSCSAAELSGHLGRMLQLIAESDLNDPRVVRRREVGGYGIDAQWSDDFHHALHAVLTGERQGYYGDFGSLGDLAQALQRVWVYDGRYSPHRRRVHGRPASGLEGWRFLGYLQNHDQIGNRAIGDRVAANLSRGRLLAGVALVCCAPFVPMLFMGEEWGSTQPFPYFVDHAEPELADAVRSGRQREFAAFGWDPGAIPDPQAPETAATAALDWTAPESPAHAEVLRWWTTLLRMRRHRACLTDGSLAGVDVEVDEQAGWLVLRRGAVSVAVNLGPEPAHVPVGPGGVVVASHPFEGGVLPPDSVVVVDRSV